MASGAEAGEGGTSQPYGGTAMVYGPRQWFSPCAWNDERCHVAVSRATPLLRRGPQGLRRALSRWTAAARLQLAYANGDAKASVQDRSSILVRQAVDGAVHGGAAAGGGGGDGGSVGGDGDRVDEGEVQKVEGEHGQEEEREVRLVGSLDVVGMHHFSGSWLGYDGSKAERAKDAVGAAVVVVWSQWFHGKLGRGYWYICMRDVVVWMADWRRVGWTQGLHSVKWLECFMSSIVR